MAISGFTYALHEEKEVHVEKRSRQIRVEEEELRGDDSEIVGVSIADENMSAMPIQNSTLASVLVFGVSDYHQKSLYLRTNNNEDPNTPLVVATLFSLIFCAR